MAGNLWVDVLPDIAMNQSLLRDIRQRIREGLPTLALGGGMLCLLSKIQDSLGRTLELADVVPADGEILWDLDQPAYIDVTAERDTLLLARGETVKAWVASDAEIVNSSAGWQPPLALRGPSVGDGQLEGAASSSLLCSRVFVHLASRPGMGQRFVSKCADHAVRRSK
jgi:cobyrinic acid a,c-diamide synthase